MGFFSPSVLQLQQNQEAVRLPRCGACGLHDKCRSPRMPVTGEGRMKVLIVAEAPGGQEDERNTQLVGTAGQELRKCLRRIDVDLDRDCWKTNAVICCPEKTPIDDQVMACRPNLLKTVRELRPSTIVVLGGIAVKSLIGWLWKEDPGKVGRWTGWQIPSQWLNCWMCPTWHPSYVMRSKNDETDRRSGKVISLLFEQHLAAAFELEGRPWKKMPVFDQVEKMIDVDSAAVRIREMMRGKGLIAFDYETNMLKPDSDRAEVVCCALSNGKWTMAYPMHGSAVQATREFLRSPLPKIASNMKFEERWSRAFFKTSVRNWHWDTMVAAHTLDNRRGISGLKFQSFARLGQESYDDAIKPYLESSGPNVPNRIRRVDLGDLLQYNGMDASLTWHVAKKQREEMDCL